MTIHFVNQLDELLLRSVRMGSLVEDMVQEAGEAVFEPGDRLARRVISRDLVVDDEEVKVESEVIRLMALYQPVGPDLRLLCTILKVNNDLERAADSAVNIAERACHLDAAKDLPGAETIRQMDSLVRRMLRNVLQAYSAQDGDAAKNIFTEEEMVDALYAQTVKTIVAEGADSSHEMASLLDMLSVAKNLERIGDFATNIAEDVVFLSTGDIVRHQSSPEKS
jgi:phosphate transport system protein